MPLYLKDKLVSGTGAQGSPGKSAYEAAKEGGYIGTEAEFSTALKDLPAHVGNADIHVTTEEKAGWDAKADAPKSVPVTLAAASWDSIALTQTVTVSGVSATETTQIITPTPALASQAAYYKAGILCTDQTENSLTFTCTTAPTEDLTVYVVIQEVGA